MSIEFPEFNTIESPKTEAEFLERGEIESIDNLAGHAPVKVVKINNYGVALFKPADIKYPDPDFKDKEVFRGELEFLAFSIDRVLGFNLVPASAKRKLIDHDGILQRFIPKTEAVIAASLDFWSHHVDELEIKKAAIFDYITDAKDRCTPNFLVDQERKKIWLIDHDFYMFLGTDPMISPVSLIVDRARRLSNQDIPEELVGAVSNLIDKIDQISDNIQQEQIKLWLAETKKRAETLVKKRRMPTRVAERSSHDGNNNF